MLKVKDDCPLQSEYEILRYFMISGNGLTSLNSLDHLYSKTANFFNPNLTIYVLPISLVFSQLNRSIVILCKEKFCDFKVGQKHVLNVN